MLRIASATLACSDTAAASGSHRSRTLMSDLPAAHCLYLGRLHRLRSRFGVSERCGDWGIMLPMEPVSRGMVTEYFDPAYLGPRPPVLIEGGCPQPPRR